MNTSVAVWDLKDAPEETKEDILCWQSYAQGSTIASIPRYLESNADRLRAKYVAFSCDLGESIINGKRVVEHLDAGDGFSYWWMNKLSENSPFKSSRIYDCLRLMALEEILLEKKPSTLTLDSSDRDLAQAIKRLCLNLQVDFVWRKVPTTHQKWTLRRLYEILPYPIQGLISLRHLAIRWPLRRLQNPLWFAGDNAIFMCSYFFNLDSASCSAGKFYARQWEALPRYLQDSGKRANWIHHFLLSPGMPDVKTSLSWMEQFNRDAQKQGCHAFLETYLSWKIIFRVFKNWLWLNVVYWRLRQISDAFNPKGSAVWLWPLLRDDWQTSLKGTTSISNCLCVELFDAALKDIPHQNLGLYLWENQGWECALLRAWRKHGHGKIIGVPHSTIPFWYLNIFDDPRIIASGQDCTKPLPDYLAINGPMAWKALVKGSYPVDRLLEVEALRFQYLISHGSAQSKKTGGRTVSVDTSENNRRKAVLILGDFTAKQTLKMLRCIEAALHLTGVEISLTLKPHPACQIAKEDYPALSFELTNKPLAEIMQDFDLAFSSNTTSAGLDAFLSGLPVVVFLDDDDFNHSPLRGMDGVRFVGTAEEMAASLQSAGHSAAAPAIENFFWLDSQLPRWHRVLSKAGNNGWQINENEASSAHG